MTTKPKNPRKQAKKKNGRPTKYKPSFCEKLIKFFDSDPYEEREIPHYAKSGKKDKEGEPIVVWVDYKRMPNNLPTLRDFAKLIKVGTSSVYRWLDEKDGAFQIKFQDAFILAQELRKWFLIQNGLQGLYNPLFAKFTAINVTDMKDKQETEVSGTVKHEIVNFSNVKVTSNNSDGN